MTDDITGALGGDSSVDDEEDQARFQRVSAQLKVAFQALSGSDAAGSDLPDEEKPEWHRRLIAITNSSKHDLATAEKRLERYWDDWEAVTGTRPTSP
ncbi:hypothetical protein [Euzebya tangerina]|uniref:hypothetical protein n=1 Tax=Euzebya tangerina TaxID=591198 RepID=UPI000E31DE30|nr:hypothetical protein [Euzebya tangerina]